MTTPLHPSLATLSMPARIARLPRDARGFPVPAFVATVDGVPDHRVIDGRRFAPALQEKRCWICAEPLGRHLAFLLGPMCVVNRTISEPPAHRECAEYSVRACPFMARPHMHRREAGLPDEAQSSDYALQRNPGVVALWMTRRFTPFRAPDGGVLFHVGDPTEVVWYAEGRLASRAEVEASVDAGLPALQAMADQEGPQAGTVLAKAVLRAYAFFPREEAPTAEEVRA